MKVLVVAVRSRGDGALSARLGQALWARLGQELCAAGHSVTVAAPGPLLGAVVAIRRQPGPR